MSKQTNTKPEELLLYAVTDRHWLNGATLISQVEAALKGGATFIQLREKNLDDEAFYKKAAVGVDIIYNPGETMFMKLIKAQGKKAYNGLKMLLYQGVSAYELWNDCKITKEEADEVYKCLQKELGINE